jgi:hypothetical protein
MGDKNRDKNQSWKENQKGAFAIWSASSPQRSFTIAKMSLFPDFTANFTELSILLAILSWAS